MKSLLSPKYLILFIFLTFTLTWKVIARAIIHEQPSDRSIQVRIADFLIQQHFSVSILEQAEQGKPSVAANAGSCRLLVIRSPAIGWDRDLVRRYADVQDQVFVVFRGRIYSDQPTFRTVFDTLSSRLLRELGFNTWPSPIFAVVARKDCEADRLPWERIGASAN